MRRGDLFVLSWESLRRVEWGKVSSFLSMSGGGLFNSLLMGLLLRWSWTIVVWMVFMFRFIVFSSIACVGSGSMFRVYWLLLNIVFFFSRGGWGWVVSLCSGWSGCEAFCRCCELWSLRCFSIGRIFVSSCMWFMLVSEVHPVAILSPWFCVTCSAVSCLSEIIGAYIVPAYSSMGLVTVLYVFVKVSLFLPQWVEVRAFSILIVFSALSFEVLICSLNVSLGSKVSPSILGLRIVGSYSTVFFLHHHPWELSSHTAYNDVRSHSFRICTLEWSDGNLTLTTKSSIWACSIFA